MGSRGRKSADELSMVRTFPQLQRPAPPANLTAAQKKVWKAVVDTSPPGWITGAQEYLLAAYCRHVVTGNELAAMIDKQKLDGLDMPGLRRLSRLLAMRLRETSAFVALATKMRLTQQAQMHPRTAGRAMDNLYCGPRPWERDFLR